MRLDDITYFIEIDQALTGRIFLTLPIQKQPIWLNIVNDAFYYSISAFNNESYRQTAIYRATLKRY